MRAPLIISLLLILVLASTLVESKMFFPTDPREIETDCSLNPRGSKGKCCPKKCKKCNGGHVKSKKSYCHWLRVGKNGRREKCCSFSTICKPNKHKKILCKNTKRVCKWTSRLVKTFKKSQCFWTQNLGGKQRKCCKWTVKCFGEKCYDLRKKCIFTGHIVTKSVDHGCKWLIVGKNVRRQRCCKHVRVCVGEKCTLRKVDCKWASLPIKLDWLTKCRWFKHGVVREKECCSFLRRCVGTKCEDRKTTCKVVDKTVQHRYKSCKWTRFKRGRREKCCDYSTVCKKK